MECASKVRGAGNHMLELGKGDVLVAVQVGLLEDAVHDEVHLLLRQLLPRQAPDRSLQVRAPNRVVRVEVCTISPLRPFGAGEGLSHTLTQSHTLEMQ